MDKKKRIIKWNGFIIMICMLTMWIFSPIKSYADDGVSGKLSSLMNRYVGTYWTTNGVASDSSGTTSKYYYGIQCKGFANYIFSELFGVTHIGAYDNSYKYYIPNPVGATEVGKSYGFSSTDITTVSNILSKGMPGDFIQVRRRNATYGHSMILVSKDAGGITVFDCNSDGACGVKSYYISWSSFASKNIGLSLYHATNYPVSSSTSSSLTYEIENTTNITSADATISAWISNEGEISEMGFYVGSTTAYMNKITTNTAKVPWTRFHLRYNLSGYCGRLSPGQTYYYQFYVVKNGVEYKSERKQFKTSGSSVISYDSYSLGSVTDTSAQIGVWMSNPNAKKITSMGFGYGETLTSLTWKKVSGDVNWTRSHMNYEIDDYIKGLEANKSYYVRFYATVDGITYYSDFIRFTTTGKKVTFDTHNISNITDTDAQISTWFSNANAYTLDSIGFYIGKTQGSMKKIQTTGNVRWTRSNLIYSLDKYVDLEQNTKYYYQFYVLIGQTEYKSELRSFTTSVSICNHASKRTVKEKDVSATCIKNGSYEEVTYCSTCNKELSRSTKTTKALEHSWGNGVVTKEATCIAEGTMTYSCSKCGTKKTETIKVNTGKHSGNTEKRNERKTSCSVAGYTGDVFCKDCGVKIAVGLTITKLEHKEGETIKENIVSPTCVKVGTYEEVSYCSSCSAELSRVSKVIEASGHNWDGGVVTKESTCAAMGTITYSCSECGAKKTETIKADIVKHSGKTVKENIVVPTCEKVGTYEEVSYCTSCGTELSRVSKIIQALEHDWDDGTVTQEATSIEKGVKTYTCTVCGKTKTEEIEALGIPKKGSTFEDQSTGGIYVITKSDVKNGTVQYKTAKNKDAKSIVIPQTVTLNNIRYSVTSIADNAFKNNKKLTNVTIGSNVKTIGKSAFSGCTALKTVTMGKNVKEIGDKAFYGCKKLKSIVIKTKLLTTNKVGSKAFHGIYKKAVIKVPKNKLKTYTNLLKKKGVGKGVKVKCN